MKHPRLQLNKRAFWCGVAVLVLLRCGLTSFQQAYTWVGGAPLDDELMFRAAQAITAGYPLARVVTLFDGGAKYMADADSYDRITYEAMNSPFGKGAAERLTEAARALLEKRI